MMTKYIIVPLLLALISSNRAWATCDVEQNAETVFNIGKFDEENQEVVSVIFPSQVNDNDVVRLVEVDEEGGGGVAGSFWFTERQRLGDGFIATFTFRISRDGVPRSGRSDGFAFLAQNDKIVDIQGGTGANLGFKSGLTKYLAVGFDVCADRRNPDNVEERCEETRISVATEAGDITSAVFSAEDISDGRFYTATVTYVKSISKGNVLKVNIAGNDVLVDVPVPELRSIWQDDFAYFGFTGSNMNEAPADIDIAGFKIEQRKSNARILAGLRRIYDIGTRASFTMAVVDSCNVIVPRNESELFIESEDNVTATLTTQIGNPLTIFGKVSRENSGQFLILFDLPSNFESIWTLDITYDTATTKGIRIQEMPFVDAIGSQAPEINGLNRQNLLILASLICLGILGVTYWIRRLYRYKVKLDENKEHIEFGKVVEKINQIDKTVDYQMNPLLGSIEEMRRKLERNNRILAGYGDGETMILSRADLEQENALLREELARLNKEEQEKAAFKNGSNKKYGNKGKKNVMAFGQQVAGNDL